MIQGQRRSIGDDQWSDTGGALKEIGLEIGHEARENGVEPQRDRD